MTTKEVIIGAVSLLVTTFLIYLFASYRQEFIIIFDFFVYSFSQGFIQLIVLLIIVFIVFVFRKYKYMHKTYISYSIVILLLVSIISLLGFFSLNKMFINNNYFTLGYFGTYSHKEGLFFRTKEDILLDEELASKFKDFNITDDGLPNYFDTKFYSIPNIYTLFMGKKALFESIKECENFISVVVIKRNNVLKIKYIILRHPDEQDDQRNAYYSKVFDTFSALINIKGINQVDVLKDLFLYMNEVSKRSGVGELMREKEDDEMNAIINSIVNNAEYTMGNILTKYKTNTIELKTKEKIDSLLKYETAATNYFLAMQSLFQNDYDRAIKTIVKSIEYNPYFPLSTLEEFNVNYQAIYHHKLFEKQRALKIFMQDNRINIGKDEEIFSSPYYENIAKEYAIIPFSIDVLKQALSLGKGKISKNSYKLIETTFLKLSNNSKVPIYTFFYADILDDVSTTSTKETLQRIKRSKDIFIDFVKNNTVFKYITYYKIANLAFLEGVYGKKDPIKGSVDYWIEQINEHERKYGPRP